MSRPPDRRIPPDSLPEQRGWTATFSVTVPATERLDRFLADQCGLSRTQAARLIADGQVSVNGDPARPARELAREDVVDVRHAPPPPRPPLAPHDVPLPVVFEDEHLLVVDKPAGLVVHPAPGHWDDTLVNALLALGVTLAAGTRERPGIVHRLDQDTSGLMVVAKTDVAHQRLGRAIARRRVERVYAALAWGHIAGPRRIEAALARHPRDRKRMAVVATGRSAVTHVEPVATFAACDLLRVRLETGRTHQIRVHLAHVGHPVVGDPAYGGGGARRISGQPRAAAEALERAAPRQALHAASLAFAHPVSRSWLTFRAEWPDDLGEALAVASGEAELLARPQRLGYLGFFKQDG